MCGIFAYLNFLTPKTRQEILELLLNGKLFAFTYKKIQMGSVAKSYEEGLRNMKKCANS
jgi:hypothetical protein